MVHPANRDRKPVSFFGSFTQGKLPHVSPELQTPGLPPQANPVPKLAREGGKRDLSDTLGPETPKMVHPEKKRPDARQMFCFPQSREAPACMKQSVVVDFGISNGSLYHD